MEQDDREGLIRGRVRGRLGLFTSSVTIRISLDPDAQTRVDALSASRTGRMGANARRIHRFFRALDASMSEGVRRRRGSERQTTSA